MFYNPKREIRFLILLASFRSEGGMILGNYLGKYNTSKLSHAMIISVPFNAELGLIESEKPHNRLINMHIASALKKIFLK
jgi:hypothetical protein